MKIEKIDPSSQYYHMLITYAKNCGWAAGPHLAEILEKNAFTDWESAFAAIADGQIAGFCTFMKTDYYPENRYSPWISSIFVDEQYRGKRLSAQMIQTVIEYAKQQQFSCVYIPSDMIGFYEKYGFEKIDQLENYAGDMDYIFKKEIMLE